VTTVALARQCGDGASDYRSEASADVDGQEHYEQPGSRAHVVAQDIGTLAAATLGQRYRSVANAGVAGCAGIAVIDAAALITVPLVTPDVSLPIVLAMAASLARLTMAARGLRLARGG
jgi:hypothetical protein